MSERGGHAAFALVRFAIFVRKPRRCGTVPIETLLQSSFILGSTPKIEVWRTRQSAKIRSVKRKVPYSR